MALSRSCSIPMIGSARGGGRQAMEERDRRSLQELARMLRSHGLATPAIMLVDVLAPVAFIGEQALAVLAPLLPSGTWQAGAHSLVLALKDDRQRDLLQRLLADEM